MGSSTILRFALWASVTWSEAPTTAEHEALRAGRDGCQKLDEGGPSTTVVRPIQNGKGCNEVDNIPDTHGNTSDLSTDEVNDLVAYLLSIQ